MWKYNLKLWKYNLRIVFPQNTIVEVKFNLFKNCPDLIRKKIHFFLEENGKKRTTEPFGFGNSLPEPTEPTVCQNGSAEPTRTDVSVDH